MYADELILICSMTSLERGRKVRENKREKWKANGGIHKCIRWIGRVWSEGGELRRADEKREEL